METDSKWKDRWRRSSKWGTALSMETVFKIGSILRMETVFNVWIALKDGECLQGGGCPKDEWRLYSRWGLPKGWSVSSR